MDIYKIKICEDYDDIILNDKIYIQDDPYNCLLYSYRKR